MLFGKDRPDSGLLVDPQARSGLDIGRFMR